MILTASAAAAQETPPEGTPAPKPAETRDAGLPSAITWTLSVDARWGTFGFAITLYNNPNDPGMADNLSDQMVADRPAATPGD